MIDPELAVGARLPDLEVSWSESDVLLYHLGLGVGSGLGPYAGAPTEAQALAYVHEPVQHVLPTFAVMPVRLGATRPSTYDYPGVRVDPAAVLHGAQKVFLPAPLPAACAKATLSRTVIEVLDKGHAAVLTEETTLRSSDGQLLATATSQLFLRGEGGFGGARGPARPTGHDLSEHIDWVRELTVPTSPGQALLYRLSGDRNPLHSDPTFARSAGFEGPILHGLCTWGIVCHALVAAFLDADPTAVSDYGGRFAGVVLPGEELRIHALHTEKQVVARVTVPARAAAVVLDQVVLTLR